MATSKVRSTNNFGFLRLFFAIFVIFSHSFELLDGDAKREPLFKMFGTVTLSGFGVYGFFLISGYLITKSFEETNNGIAYLLKRVLRIYPGFVAAYLFSIFVIGPMVGGHLDNFGPHIVRLIFLGPPMMPGVFSGQHSPGLNSSMWTISYEFRCYLIVLVLGVSGLLFKRRWILVGTSVALALNFIMPPISGWLPEDVTSLVGEPIYSVRFMAVFGCGALFYLYRDHIRYESHLAGAAAVALLAAMFSPLLVETATFTLGGYLLFLFAFNIKSRPLSSIGDRTDLSYGMYLYAWPIQNTLIWIEPNWSPWVLFLTATAITTPFACVSWIAVEKPFLKLKVLLGGTSV